MEITYELGFEDQEEHEAYLHGPLRKPNFFKPILPTLVLCALGAVAAHKSASIWLFFTFLFVAIAYLLEAIQKSYGWKKVINAFIETDIPNDIHLIINDKGIQKTINNEVVLFAPWSAIGAYLQLERVWVFHLVGGHRVLVSATAISGAGPTAGAELTALLQRHGIAREA